METAEKPRLTRIGLAMLFMAVFIAGPICVVLVQSGRRESRERDASTSLKTLSGAEADFRANDRDWNHVNDFWTADVKGLYTLTQAAVRGAKPHDPLDPPLRLIEPSIARADVDEALIPAGGENLPLSLFGTPSARNGYWYAALIHDLTVRGSPESSYRLDTGGTPAMGNCHNTSKFGFGCVPDSESEGRLVFIVNENNTIFRAPMTTPANLTRKTPPGLYGIAPVYRDWPSDEELKAPRF